MALIKVKSRGTDSVVGAGKNLIINGGMQVWQRATATTTSGTGSYKTVDRFQLYESTNGVYTTEQSTGNSGDTGHDTALQANVTTVDSSIGGGQYAAIIHRIEAQNLQHLQWGTAAGKNLVLSFWVKSNKTGIYSLSTEKNDATTYRRVNEFTINSANTWEQKTINIPPLTNSNSGGTITNDNGLGIKFEWCLAYGSTFTTTSLDQWITSAHFASTNQVNWMDSTSNNFYLTGVQLEVGDTATDFEHRSFGEELALCQRYCIDLTPISGTSPYIPGNAACANSTVAVATVAFPTQMRATPALEFGAAGDYRIYNGSTITATAIGINGMSPVGGGVNFSCSGGLATASAVGVYAVSNSVRTLVSAEL